MTRDELIAKLRDLGDGCDAEADHGDAEDWLLEFVNDPEIKAAWDNRRDQMGWWYA